MNMLAQPIKLDINLRHNYKKLLNYFPLKHFVLNSTRTSLNIHY